MKDRPLGCLVEVVETLALTIIIFLVVQNFVAQPFRVEQTSMEDTLCPQQYVLVDKLTPRFSPYARGDIVVFTPPVAEGREPFIKRVIGLPGDVVAFRDGDVSVNGTHLDEPYLFDGQPTEPQDMGTSVTVPDGQLFLMGDHRSASKDSRYREIGTIPISTVVGRAWVRYWPIDTFEVVTRPSYAAIAPGGAAPSPSGAPRPSPAATAAAGSGAGMRVTAAPAVVHCATEGVDL